MNLALYHLPEPPEDVRRIIRTRHCLGMVLDRKERQFHMLHAFFGAVIEVSVSEACLPVQAADIDAIIVVLRGYFDPSGEKVSYRVIASMMAEFKLVSSATHGEAQYLVTEANTENRLLAYNFLGIIDRIRDCFGIAGPVT